MQADDARICSFEDGKHGEHTTKMNHAAVVGGNMLVVAGASVEVVAEFVVSPTVPLRWGEALEPTPASDSVRRLVGMAQEDFPEARIGPHLHDTRGLGPANVTAALEMGIDLYDSSIAGLGGCPFAGHGDARGAGNICTEDMVFLCHELGIETGIDLERLIEAARFAERVIGRPLAGRIMHSGSLKAYRRRPVEETAHAPA